MVSPTFLRIYGRGSTGGLTLTTTSSTSHARQQCPNRWKMRERRVKCMVSPIIKLEVFAEIFEKIVSYEGHSVDELSALNIHAHWVQSLSTHFTHLARCVFGSAACQFVPCQLALAVIVRNDAQSHSPEAILQVDHSAKNKLVLSPATPVSGYRSNGHSTRSDLVDETIFGKTLSSGLPEPLSEEPDDAGLWLSWTFRPHLFRRA